MGPKVRLQTGVTARGPRLVRGAVLAGGLCLASVALAAATWVDAIHTSQRWAAYACEERLLSRVCDLDKDYEDPGTLAPQVSIGDVVRYQNRRGQDIAFTVRAIKFVIFERDADERRSAKGHAGKRGDTVCFLFDTASREGIARGYASRIVVKDCLEVRK